MTWIVLTYTELPYLASHVTITLYVLHESQGTSMDASFGPDRKVRWRVQMKIHFVGHACIVAECADTSILMDPWLFGKIFNDSWTLLPEPKFDPAMLEKVDYIWISHEHPDHCHFPTLGSFPADFKARVTILFQDRDYTKMFAAFRKLGYERFQRLPHRMIVPLSG